MKNTRFHQLFRAYAKNTAGRDELDELLRLLPNAEEEDLKALIDEGLNAPVEDSASHVQHTAELYPALVARINQDDKRNTLFLRPTRSFWWRTAAAIAVIAVSGILIVKLSGDRRTAAINPGRERATLLLGGHSYHLNGPATQTSYKTHGVIITHPATGLINYRVAAYDTAAASVYNKVKTPAGGEYTVRLSDGTLVKLNAGSTLEFPVGFYKKQRRVKLSGEAYFEVAKDASKPFVVEAKDVSITVLGTHFNVSSFDDEEGVRTTLSEGRVIVRGDRKQALLTPGEEALFTAGRMLVSTADTLETTAWAHGIFMFNNRPLKSIVANLSRWYDFDYEVSALPDVNLYVRINRNMSFSEVLKVLNASTDLRFYVEGRRLHIHP